MNDFLILLIISGSIITSIWQYRELILISRSISSKEDLYKLIGENALIEYICNMDDGEFQLFCMRFFKTIGYTIKDVDNDIVVLKTSRKITYAFCIRADKDEKITVSQVMQLYGYMCHDNIGKGIMITSSIFDSSAYNICSEIGIKTFDVYDILYELKGCKEDEMHELIPELN